MLEDMCQKNNQPGLRKEIFLSYLKATPFSCRESTRELELTPGDMWIPGQ